MSYNARRLAFFLHTEGRALFSLYYPAKNNAVAKGFILHIPAFAEEMNKSRRMVTLQAQQFAENGYAVLLLDLFGTGDSSGDFSEATWQHWQRDLSAACLWLQEQGALSVILWGLRTGALLAMDFAAIAPIKIDQVLCWQPVLNGELFIMQFLRLRIAAAMMDKNAPQEKTADLKQQLLNGIAIEVAGYCLNPDLIKPLLTLSANQIDGSNIAHLSLIEMVVSSDKSLSVNNVKFVETWQRKNQAISTMTVVGDPFWAAQEITEIPELITASINCLSISLA